MNNKDFEMQRKVAYAAGFLQGDITIKALLESLAEGVVIVNEHGLIVLINKRMEELCGYTRQEIMGQSLDIFVPDESHEKHHENVNKFFAEPRMRPMGVGLELMAKNRTGKTFPVEISLSFLETEVGNLGIAFVTDISMRKQMEQELQERNKELDAYAHTVAHDLNSSLLVMSGYSGLLLEDHESISSEAKRDYLEQISKHSKLMSSVISELLLFSRVGTDGVQCKGIDVEQTIKNACERLYLQIKHKSAQLNISSPIIKCMGYAPWVEEIWFNLISNALKYGNRPPVIEIGSVIAEDGSVRYSITDNGDGVPEELQSVLFEESDSIKDQHKKGHGLGLAIVKRIVNKLGGEVGYEKSPDSGSTFFFTMKTNDEK